jgi:hypothetical protein
MQQRKAALGLCKLQVGKQQYSGGKNSERLFAGSKTAIK